MLVEFQSKQFEVGQIVQVDLDGVHFNENPDRSKMSPKIPFEEVAAATAVLSKLRRFYRSHFVRRGIGSEQIKSRPCLIISAPIGLPNMFMVLLISDNTGGTKCTEPSFVPIPESERIFLGLAKSSSICCEEMQSISSSRIGTKQFGKLSLSLMFKVRSCLSEILQIGPEHLPSQSE